MRSGNTPPNNDCSEEKCRGRTLTEMVDWYKRKIAPAYEELRKFDRSLSPLEEAVHLGAMAIMPNEKMDGHQHLVGKDRCGRASRRLKGRLAEIERCRRFEALHDLVSAATSTIKGFGPLARYDTTRRIGLSRNINPNFVYLHCGSARCARALELKAVNGRVDPSDLPDELKNLPLDDVENFLCICEENLKLLAGRR